MNTFKKVTCVWHLNSEHLQHENDEVGDDDGDKDDVGGSDDDDDGTGDDDNDEKNVDGDYGGIAIVKLILILIMM